jgi:hypothetical protein
MLLPSAAETDSPSLGDSRGECDRGLEPHNKPLSQTAVSASKAAGSSCGAPLRRNHAPNPARAGDSDAMDGSTAFHAEGQSVDAGERPLRSCSRTAATTFAHEAVSPGDRFDLLTGDCFGDVSINAIAGARRSLRHGSDSRADPRGRDLRRPPNCVLSTTGGC